MDNIHTVNQSVHAAWETVLEEVDNNTLVYIDAAASESLRWGMTDGAACLMEKGAYTVLNLLSNSQHKQTQCTVDPSQPCLQPRGQCIGLQTRKVVIVAGSLLSNFTSHLKVILEKNKFTECIVFCGHDARAHTLLTETGDYLAGLESELQEWLLTGFTATVVKSTLAAEKNIPKAENSWGSDDHWDVDDSEWDDNDSDDGWGKKEEAGGWADESIDDVPIASIRYVPILVVSPVKDSFFIPSLVNTPTFIPSDVVSISEQYKKQFKSDSKAVLGLDDVHIHMLSKEKQRPIRELGCALTEAIETLRLKVDVYSLGHMSRLVAREAIDAQKKGVGASTRFHAGADSVGIEAGGYKRASLILVDRSLDLAGPIIPTDSIADLILNMLPSKVNGESKGSLDVDVNLSTVLGASGNTNSVPSDAGCALGGAITGTISHRGKVARDVLNDLFYLRSRQSLINLRNTLVQTIAKAKLPMKKGVNPSKVTYQHLQSLLDVFQKGGMATVAKHFGLISLTTAVVESLMPRTENDLNKTKNQASIAPARVIDMSPSTSHLRGLGNNEHFVAVAKEVVLSGMQPGDSHSLYTHMTDVLAANKLSIEEILLCCVLGASILGPDCIPSSVDEKLFVKAFLPVVESHLTPTIELTSSAQKSRAWLIRTIRKWQGVDNTDGINEVLVENWLKDCLRRIWGVANGRSSLTTMLKDVLCLEGSRYTQLPYRPLLANLFEQMFEQQVEVPDLILHENSRGLRRKLYSGFVNLVQATPRPTDHRYIILFVIGGISASEMKHIHDIVQKFDNFTVLIGSTHWATVSTIFEDVICSERYKE
eukprot:CFRG1580T1